MKKSLFSVNVSLGFLLLLSLGFLGIQALEIAGLRAQTAAVPLKPTSTISWDEDTLSITYEIRLVNHDDVPDTTNIIGLVDDYSPPDANAPTLPAANLIGAANNGSDYKVFVRGQNSYGAGPWSEGLLVTVDLTPSQIQNVTAD